MKAVLLICGIALFAAGSRDTIAAPFSVVEAPSSSALPEPAPVPPAPPAPIAQDATPKVAPTPAASPESTRLRPCARYGRRVDSRKVRAVTAVAQMRGVGLYWVNPPMRETCVARR